MPGVVVETKVKMLVEAGVVVPAVVKVVVFEIYRPGVVVGDGSKGALGSGSCRASGSTSSSRRGNGNDSDSDSVSGNQCLWQW